MISRFYFWFILIFTSLDCYSQVDDGFPLIGTQDIPEAGFSAVRTFNGASLFGYINGGAELYLEYGFSAASVAEISLMGGKYKTEIYRMTGAEEAFGIFSVSKYSCRSMPQVSSFTCMTKYQLQICAGSYYISIINATGTKTDSLASVRIGEAIVNKIKEPQAAIAEFLPGIDPEIIKRDAILAKGRLGIMNGAPDFEDYFRNATGYIAVILPSNESTLLSVRFNTRDDLNNFITAHNLPGEEITLLPAKLLNGETVSKLSDNHLLIVISK